MSATVYQAFLNAVQRWPSHAMLDVLPETAAIYGIAPGEMTFGDASHRIQALRVAYQQAGYGHGHRAGLLLENRPDFFLHWYALNSLGVSVVPINADLRAAELEYLIGHSEIVIVVALPNYHDALRQAAHRANQSLAIITADAHPPLAATPAPFRDRAPDVHTECALLYTSGTTGRPKGCILPNRYFLHAGAWYASIGGLATLHEGQERMITPLPLVHMNAMAYSAMAMLLTGGCLIALDRFHPQTWWDSVRTSRATVLHYLGVMPAMLMKAAPSAADQQHHVRFGFGAGVDRTLHEPFESRFGFPLLEAWAMTETGAGAVVIANHEPRHRGHSCFGTPNKDVHIRIVDDAGHDVTGEQPGELLVRHAGPEPRYGFFAGYLKDEAATTAAWQDNWFHTGDLVRRGPDGNLYFVDRKKNVIRRSGENISAVEVESVLAQHPLVKSVAVAAVPDAVRGDEVLACIVPVTRHGDAATRQEAAQDIVRWCLSQLAYYKAPGHVAFVESLPLTTTNKIQRGEMKRLAPTLVGTESCVDTCSMKKRQEVSA